MVSQASASHSTTASWRKPALLSRLPGHRRRRRARSTSRQAPGSRGRGRALRQVVELALPDHKRPPSMSSSARRFFSFSLAVGLSSGPRTPRRLRHPATSLVPVPKASVHEDSPPPWTETRVGFLAGLAGGPVAIAHREHQPADSQLRLAVLRRTRLMRSLRCSVVSVSTIPTIVVRHRDWAGSCRGGASCRPMPMLACGAD